MKPGPKLLHIVGGSEYGGGAQVMVSLVEAARSMGFQVDVLVSGNPTSVSLMRSAGAGVVDIDVIRRPVRPLWDLIGLIKLTRFLAKADYSVVQTHTSKAGFVGRLAARLARVPVIIHTVHGFAFHDFSSSVARFLYVGLERLAAHWCDLIVTVSEHHREVALISRIGSPDTVLAIPNGISADRVKSQRPPKETREALGIKEGDIMLLSTGRLAQQKGLTYLIQAMAQLVGTHPNLRLLLAGEGDLRADLESEVVQMDLTDHVSFLGLRLDIADLLNSCDIVTLPSLWEGLSISLLEAMAAGKAVVTTTIASNIEVTDSGACAVLVTPASTTDLVHAIERLVGDAQLRADLGHQGALIFEARYTTQRMLDAYTSTYRELCESKRVPLPLE